MKLTPQQMTLFQTQGFLILPSLFSNEEVDLLTAEIDRLLAETRPENALEAGGKEVRNLHSIHKRSRVFDLLSRHPRLLEPARQILGEDTPLYLQQCKINLKAPFVGAGYEWHTDFATHHNRDGVPLPLALNLHVFLDDVTEFNGPLYFAPGSQRMDVSSMEVSSVKNVDSKAWELWTVPNDVVRETVNKTGLVSIKGPRGTGLIFGDLLLHVSGANISPWSRRIASSIVNPVSNRMTRMTDNQPLVFQHERDFTPLVTASDDCLRAKAAP
ncbi:MAG: phytanoyl-CoA dioxygenase family protein [Rhodoferax sp.]|uniref:phytanoyl-CoA dioxygenase family protein n=1 Tax=Rhodoferax sp. TaxID=50421 RepID=UPI0026177B26|nr:phytanoyl-CoA dioxygenase family protein [Rhodoferax sp.]MDD5336275.1 phytanoyl-CoA dioxygenase family protein [Rhodoferax sp.]